MNLIGRKRAMMAFSIPFIMGWGCIVLSKLFSSVYLIYFGRVLTGFSGASFLVFVPVYVAECCHISIRGALTTMMMLMLTGGVLFTFIIGTFVSWWILPAILGIFPMLLLIGMPFLPETPRYLISKGLDEEASRSLQWLRGATSPAQVKAELKQIVDSYSVDKEESSRLKDLFVPSSLKPTLIALALIFFMQMCGANAVSLYQVEVFRSAGTDIDPNLASILVALCQCASVFIPTFLVDRLGRKKMLLTSEAIMIVSLMALGIFFYFKGLNNGEVPQNFIGYVPLPAFILFTLGYNVGVGPLTFLVISEILPSQSRGLSTSIVVSLYWTIIFVSAKTFDDLINFLGWTVSYGLFAGICVLGTIFIIMFVPETKGKTSEEIELHFKRKSTVRRVSLKMTRSNSLGETQQNDTTGGTTNRGFCGDDNNI